LLSNALQQKSMINPIGLAMSRGFFKPTKTGSFFESLGNVGEEVQGAQQEMAKNEIGGLQARIALAKAQSDREREKDTEALMSQLYEKTPAGLRTNPQIAQKLFGITKDPRFVQQAMAEEQQLKMRDIGRSMFTPKVVDGKNTLEFNPNAIYNLMDISADPVKAISEYASMIPKLRQSGLISGLKEEGTPFDALVMMAPNPAIKKQAEYLADRYSKGSIDPDKALTMANSMMTMAQAHMDREQAQKFQQGMSIMMANMKSESNALEREKFAEKQKENEKKMTDEQKITYRDIVVKAEKQAMDATNAIAGLNQLETVARSAPEGIISGGFANSVGKLFNTDDATALRNLESLSKGLIPMIPRLPGSASNLDAKNLEESIGRLSDIRMDNKTRVQVIKEIREGFERLQNRGNELKDYWDEHRKLPKWVNDKGPTPKAESAGTVDFNSLPPKRQQP